MNLIAIIPAGMQVATVNGLTQWDYGRKLEIRSEELPAMVEVHFACEGMQTAIVRACEALGGVAEATIPDTCLEQTSPITAWVYAIGETSGETIMTLTLPIQARVRPQTCTTPPEEITDKYTEAVTAMNEAVDSLKEGGVTVNNALHANVADKATLDGKGNSIVGTYGNFNNKFDTGDTLATPGWYYLRVIFNGDTFSYGSLVYWDGKHGVITVLDASPSNDNPDLGNPYDASTVHRLIIAISGNITVKRWQSIGQQYETDVTKNVTVEYALIKAID